MIDNAPDCHVMSPSIQGRGLFAGKSFTKGEVIVDFTEYRKDFYKIRYNQLNDYQLKYNWSVQVDQDHCLTFDRFSKFSYINHSRTPNCEWMVYEYLIIAARNIRTGEEITIDYRTQDRPVGQNFPDWV